MPYPRNRLWFAVAFFCGIGFLVGVLATVYDLFFPKPAQHTNVRPATARAAV